MDREITREFIEVYRELTHLTKLLSGFSTLRKEQTKLQTEFNKKVIDLFRQTNTRLSRLEQKVR